MKKVGLSAIVLLCVLLLVASCVTIQSDKIEEYQQVAEFEGMTKDELYTKAQSWFVETFNDSKEVIEVKDENAGLIKGKYALTIRRNTMTELILESVITVDIKDGKARFTISPPVSSYALVGYNRTVVSGYTKEEVEKLNISRASLFDSFKNYLVTAPEDW